MKNFMVAPTSPPLEGREERVRWKMCDTQDTDYSWCGTSSTVTSQPVLCSSHYLVYLNQINTLASVSVCVCVLQCCVSLPCTLIA